MEENEDGRDPGGDEGGGRPPKGERKKRREDTGKGGSGGHGGKGGHSGHSGIPDPRAGHVPKKTLIPRIPTSQTQIDTHTHTNTNKHQNTIVESDEETMSTSQTSPKQDKTNKTPALPTHEVRGWTLNREDGKMYNSTGQSRIPTSEEWRAFKLLDIQWHNKLTKQRQQQEQQRQRQLQQQQRRAQQQQRLEIVTSTPKRKISQVDDSKDEIDQGEKVKKITQTNSDNVDWNSDAVKHSTIRILADKDDQALDQEDIQHINRLLMRATFNECKGDLKKWKTLQPDKMSLMHPNFVIRLRIPSKEGVEFWRKFIPTVPPRSEGGYKYRFLAPGENLTEKVCFFVHDVSLAENKEEDIAMLAFTIRAGNDEFEKTPFKLRCTGVDSKSHKAVMIMELLTADRLRCLGPKPDNPDKDPEWKIRIGLSTTKVTIAFAKSKQIRKQNELARLEKEKDENKATTSPKPSTSRGEIEEIEIDLEKEKEEIDKALESDDDEIGGIQHMNRILIDEVMDGISPSGHK